jgi:hypothetical protein
MSADLLSTYNLNAPYCSDKESSSKTASHFSLLKNYTAEILRLLVPQSRVAKIELKKGVLINDK